MFPASRLRTFKFGIETRTTAICVGLVGLLCLFEELQFNDGVATSFASLYPSQDIVSTVFGTAYLFVSLVVLYGLMVLIFTAKLPVRFFAFAILALVVATEFSYLRAIGRFTNTFDITAAMTATSEQKTDSLAAYISFAWVPFAIIVALLAYLFSDRRRRFGVGAATVWLAVVLVYYAQVSLLGPLLVGQRVVSNSFDAFAQTAVDFALSKPMEIIDPPKREVLTYAADQMPTKNIVLIFDESIRGDHLSLNGYYRKTTPYLEQLAKQEKLINWGIAVSASTSSHPSYDAFITGATPEMLESMPYNRINSMPTLFQYAKAMNFRTHLLDGQMKYYWGGIKEDLSYIDKYINLNDISPNRVEDYEKGGKNLTSEDDREGMKQWEIDLQLATMVNEIFSCSTGNFVFLYKRGVHFPYEKNYPTDKARWEPVYYFGSQWEVPPLEARDAIINSYDNSIVYNLDEFFRTLKGVSGKIPENTVIIYTSDHGESIYVGGKAGHGGDTSDEANVPLFALGLDEKSIDTKFGATHANLFSGLLDLFEFPEDGRRHDYAISLLKAKKNDTKQRFFNLTDGKKVMFDD